MRLIHDRAKERRGKNADCKGLYNCCDYVVFGFELPGSQDKNKQTVSLSFEHLLGNRCCPRPKL